MKKQFKINKKIQIIISLLKLFTEQKANELKEIYQDFLHK